MVTHTCHSNILDTGKGEFLLGGQPRLHSKTLSLKNKLTVRGGAFTQPLGWQWQADLCKSKASATQQVLGQSWLCSEIPSQKHKQTKNTVKKKSNEHKVKIDRNPPQSSIRGTWFLLTYSMSFRRVMQSRFPNEHTFTGCFSSVCRPSGSSTE